jgi:hypothetical protein
MDTLELLEYFGIIRPFMLKQLIDIRNLVEHEDSSPPPIGECLTFADLIWYFLRSTDGLAKVLAEAIIFRPPSGMPQFSQVMIDFVEPTEPQISAMFLMSLISYEARENWIKIVSGWRV